MMLVGCGGVWVNMMNIVKERVVRLVLDMVDRMVLWPYWTI